MTETHDHRLSPKIDPEELALRPRPPVVTRLSRRALAVLVGIAGAAVLGALVYALDPPRLFRKGPGAELYNTDAKPAADGLSALPKDYAGLPKPPPPKLGPALPGDLGRPILNAQGAGPAGRANPEDAAWLKREQEAEQAMRSRVFFQTATQQAPRPARAPVGVDDASGLHGTSAGPVPTDLSAGANDPYVAQNMQDQKLAFLNAPADRQIYAAHRMQAPVSRYQLMAGTIIAGALVTGISSDLPGFVKAQITENVYDTISGLYCLVPQGSQLVGQYDSHVAFGQRRALVVWTRLIRPDGTSIVLDRLPATDPEGYAGLEDGVDYHWGRIFAAAAVSTVLGIGAELGADYDDRLVRALRRGGQDTFNQAGQQIVQRNLQIQPTLTMRPGLPLRVIINRDIVLPPYRGSSGANACRA